MTFIKRAIVAILAMVMILSLPAFAIQYEIKDFGIKTINIPEEYMSCSLDVCDEDLSNLLKANGYTFEQWVSGVLEPNDFKIYACNKEVISDCMYLICKKITSPKTADGEVSHKLACDYNLMSEGKEMTEFLNEKKVKSNFDSASWITDMGDTPYIEYTTLIGNDYCHCYETIYNGNLITLQFSSKNDFSSSQKNAHRAVLNSISYSENADYTEVNELIQEKLQKKLEEETHSGENTKILRTIISISIVFVIGFAILLAIRSQKKKRKKTIVLREHEVAPESDENTNE